MTSSPFTPGTKLRIAHADSSPVAWIECSGKILRAYDRAGTWDWIVEMDVQPATTVAFFESELEPLS